MTQEICSLGFTPQQAVYALANSGGNIEEAISFLLDNPSDPSQHDFYDDLVPDYNPKPEPCHYWNGNPGSCYNGQQCRFAHDRQQPNQYYRGPVLVEPPRRSKPQEPSVDVALELTMIRDLLEETKNQLKIIKWNKAESVVSSIRQYISNFQKTQTKIALLISVAAEEEGLLPELIKISQQIEDVYQQCLKAVEEPVATQPIIITTNTNNKKDFNPQSTKSSSSSQLNVKPQKEKKPKKGLLKANEADFVTLESDDDDQVESGSRPKKIITSSSSSTGRKSSSNSRKTKRSSTKGSGSAAPPLPSSPSPGKRPAKDSAMNPVPIVQNQPTLFILPERDYDHRNEDEFCCSICFDDVPAGDGYKAQRCQHQFCCPCLKAYLEDRISGAEVLNIPCMDQSCKEMLDYYDVKTLVSEDSFRKYEEFCFMVALKEDPNVRFCPNPKSCGNALVCDPTQSKKIICSECRYEFCFDCSETWHSGTCQEYQEWKVQNNATDAAFHKWAKENSKSCPNCKAVTQKNTGCNHMTCAHCRFDWCWICDKKVTGNHYDITNLAGCPGQQFTGGDEIRHTNYGKKALIGSGIVVGGAVAIPLGIAAVAGVAATAVCVAVPVGVVYGGYKLSKAATKSIR